MAHNLPLEILSRIASHLKGKQDLFNLCLTCSNLRDAAMPYRWEHLKVGTPSWGPRRHPDAAFRWDQLRHVKKLDMQDLDPRMLSNTDPRGFDQSLKLCFTHITNLEEIKIASCYWKSMDRTIFADLAAIRSLNRLTLCFPERSIFDASAYEEILGLLERLGNLNYLKCSIRIQDDAREVLAIARILARCPTLRTLDIEPYYRLDSDPDDELWADLIRLFSSVCVQYSEIRSRSIEESEIARLGGDWKTYRRLSTVPLLSLDKLVLRGNTIVCAEIHQLMDTQILEHLSISATGWEMGQESPYYGTQGALQLLAGRAPKLSSVTFESFDEAIVGSGLELPKDFPALNEFSLCRESKIVDSQFSMEIDSQYFVDIMSRFGGAGRHTTMWKRLSLDWRGSEYHESGLEHICNVATPVLYFLKQCVNLTYLRITLLWDTWHLLVALVEHLPQLSELYLTIEWPSTREGQIRIMERSSGEVETAAEKMFQSNPSLKDVFIVAFISEGAQPWAWRRFGNGVRPVTPREDLHKVQL